MVAVEHHMLRVDLAHRVQNILGRVGAAALRQGVAFKGHAGFDFGCKQRARLQEDQLVVEVAKSLLRLQMQVDACPLLVPLQRLLYLVEQVIAADQELDRLFQHVEFFAQRVFQGPGQGDYALRCDFHTRIVAAWRIAGETLIGTIDGYASTSATARWTEPATIHA